MVQIIQAMNARRIAKVLQAEKYALQEFQSAENLYEYMIASAIQGKQISKQLLKIAQAVAQGYDETRASQFATKTIYRNDKPWPPQVPEVLSCPSESWRSICAQAVGERSLVGGTSPLRTLTGRGLDTATKGGATTRV